MKKVFKKLRTWGIDKDSEYGKLLIKLDSIYEKIEDIDNEINILTKYKEQYKDDADFIENALMYMFNKDSRKVDIKDIKDIHKK